MSREFQLIEKEAIFGIESQGIENLLKGEYIGNTGLFERGVSALLMFMQQSFTGPTLNLEEKVIDLKLLSIDGEDIYHLTPHAYLLLEAKQILIDNASDIQGFESLDWWAARTAFVHQRILEEHSATLKSLILSLYEKSIFN
jgi:hypothetical protein